MVWHGARAAFWAKRGRLVSKLPPGLLLGILAGLPACQSRPATELPAGVPAGMQLIPADAATGQPAFLLDRDGVSGARFGAFVQTTGYRTDAERLGSAGVLDSATGAWGLVRGACWRRPRGPAYPPAPPDHPVTQVSWRDARAYCHWAGRRLPTAAEWERAARYGTPPQAIYSWGRRLVVAGAYRANVWQGEFPGRNTAADGYRYTAPVGRLGRTAAGLSDMGGNVWQWCADADSEADADSVAAAAGNPDQAVGPPRLLKGGSFLCAAEVCHGYRIAGRLALSPESALFHVGFRTARSLPTSAEHPAPPPLAAGASPAVPR